MNKKDLLRQLGWSNDLISEVTRVSDTIETVAKNIRPLEKRTHSSSIAGSSIYYDPQVLNTSYQLFTVKNKKV